MNYKNEQTILKIIKYTPPLFIISMSLFLILFLYLEYNNTYIQEKRVIEKEFIDINKKTVKVYTYENIFESLENKSNLKLVDEKEIDTDTVVIHPLGKSETLHLKPKVYLGMGCNRGTSFEDIEKSFFWFLNKYALEIEQIQNIASFEAKANEEGLLKFAKEYNFDIKFFNEEEINNLEGTFSPSQATKFFGLKGVAEPSSMLVSKYKELIIPKEVYEKKITIAGAI